MKRIVLFLATNLAVVLVLSIVAQVHRPRRLAGRPRRQPRRAAGVRGVLRLRRLVHLARHVEVDGEACHGRARHRPAVGRCHRAMAARAWCEQHARAVGVGMPEVGIFDSPEPNAFATGASRNSALVAVSTGLLQRMNRQEIEAVLGHEMTHVANGDMVTLTLRAGRGQHLRDLPVAHHRQHHRPRRVPLRATAAASPLSSPSSCCSWCSGFSPTSSSCGSRGSASSAPTAAARSSPATDNMIAALEELKRVHEPLPSQQFAAFGIADGSIGERLAAAVHEPSAAR